MKLLYFPLSTLILILSGSKSNSVALKSHDGTTYWKLLEADWGIVYLNVDKPNPDSPMELVLTGDRTYFSKLAGQTVCSGQYEITKDNVLELHNFKPTGMFSLCERYLQHSIGHNS